MTPKPSDEIVAKELRSALWKGLLKKGRELKKREDSLQWEWGDLALEVEPISAHGVNTGSLERLRTFADDLDLNFNTLLSYRQVAAAWPDNRRLLSASWGIHQVLTSLPSRFDAIRRCKTVSQARQLATHRHSGPAVEPPDPVIDERVARARELLEDPEVAKSLMAVPKVRSALHNAEIEHLQEHREQREVEIPGRRESRERYETMEALEFATKVRSGIARRLAVLKEITLSDLERNLLEDEWVRVQSTLGWLLSYLQSGSKSFNQELTKLLSEAGE